MPYFAIKIVLLFFVILITNTFSSAVPPQSDFEMLQAKETDENAHIHSHDIRFMRSRSKNVIIRYNPVSLVFGGLMYTYQRFISPQLPSECLYVHNCSNFSKDLFYEYGLVKGLFTTSDRLLRCNRLSALDIHPLMIDENSGKVMDSIDIYKSEDR
jgi:putative component of membrane protein insertase Oxa1/YidC/SpoIIIJ protein YidD